LSLTSNSITGLPSLLRVLTVDFLSNTIGSTIPEAELVAVASRTIEKAESFKDKHGMKIAFSSYEDMAKSDDIDIVYVATPHSFHKENAILCIDNGKHVLCEKPFTINSGFSGDMCHPKACSSDISSCFDSTIRFGFVAYIGKRCILNFFLYIIMSSFNIIGL